MNDNSTPTMHTTNIIEKTHNKPHVVWIHPGLHGAWYQPTWFEMTREIRRLGWEVTLITDGPKNLKQIYGVDVECIPKPNIYILSQIVFHIQLLRKLFKQWDSINFILFNHMTLPWILPLKLFRRYRKSSDVLFVIDTRTVPMELKHKSSLKDKIRSSYYHLIRQADDFIADGQTAITERLAKMVGISHERLWGTWPSGVNLDRFSAAIQDRKWPADGDPLCLIYVGILNYERNISPLAQAVLKANDEGMNVSLSLIGMGTEQEALEEIARQNRTHISLLPPVPHTEIPSQLAKAHIGVLPFPDLPQFRVSSPIKLFEYMASGLPIFATRIDCHTDVIKDGKFVFWAEDSSQERLLAGIRHIWENRLSLQQMSLESLRAAESWTWEKSAQRLLHALEYGLELHKRDRVKIVPGKQTLKP